METGSTNLGNQVVKKIQEKIEISGINNNEFYNTFKSEELDKETLKFIFQQYYYYIRTFPQILSGLAPRVDDELIRLKVCRTVVSELGDGHGEPHFSMFKDALNSIGVSLDPYESATYNPETKKLVSELERLFLSEPPNYAIGAHYVIEEFGLPMIINLYEGFRQYSGWKHEDYNYFYLHILIESNHVDWIQDALLSAAKDDYSATQLLDGADQVLVALSKFWEGLNRIVLNSQQKLKKVGAL